MIESIRIKISDILLSLALFILPKNVYQKSLLKDVIKKYTTLTQSYKGTFPNEIN